MSHRRSHRRGSAAARQHGPSSRVPQAPVTQDQDESLVDMFLDQGRRLVQMHRPLDVELAAASLIVVPRRLGLDSDLADLAVTGLLRDDIADEPCDESAAILRAIIAVGSPPQRSAATSALGEVTDSGFYPPAWAATIGRPAPVIARRRYDVFGDTETIEVVFAYGPDQHALRVRTDLFRPPTVVDIAIVDNPETGPRTIQDGTDPLSRWEDLDLAAARARIEPALDRCEQSRRPALPEQALAYLPVARVRIRRLPRPPAAPPEEEFSTADRHAAVAAFLSTPAARDAGDPDVVRFWAEVLIGYSSLVPGTPPTRVGPLRLAHILLGYLPTMVELAPAHRRGLPAAVSAWTRWAADVQELDDAARELLTAQLPTVLARFDTAYDDPDNTQHRAYLRDLPVTTTEASTRAAVLARRAIAVPAPDARTGDSAKRIIDVSDPAERRAVIRDEYGTCDPPGGASRTVFLDAVEHVSEQLWYDDPPQTWQTARGLLAHGIGQHEILHQLARTALG